jgi:hypothetical protein
MRSIPNKIQQFKFISETTFLSHNFCICLFNFPLLIYLDNKPFYVQILCFVTYKISIELAINVSASFKPYCTKNIVWDIQIMPKNVNTIFLFSFSFFLTVCLFFMGAMTLSIITLSRKGRCDTQHK